MFSTNIYVYKKGKSVKRAGKMSRSYQEELNYLERINEYSWRIKKGFVPNMRVSASSKLTLIHSEVLKFQYDVLLEKYCVTYLFHLNI